MNAARCSGWRARLQHERQHAVRVEAGLDARQRDDAAQHQAGANQQDERQRHLGDDHRAAQPASASQPAARTTNRAQRFGDVGARRAQRRHQTAQHGGAGAGDDREREHPRIHRNRPEPRQFGRSRRDQDLDPGPCQQQAERRAERRHQQALGEHLPDQPAARRADRRPDRELAAARRGAHDQEIGDVRARNQQHERDGAHHRQDRRPHVADDVVEHRDRVEVETRGLLDRIVRAQIRRDAVHLQLRLLGRHARLQTADHAKDDVVAVGGVEIDARRRPHVRRPVDADARREQQLESRRENADDARAAVAELDVLADDRRIAAVTPLPERVAQDRGDRNLRRRCLVRQRRRRRPVVGDEIAPDNHPRAEHAKQIRRRAADADLLRLLFQTGNRHAAGGDHAGEVVEDVARLLLEVAQIGRRERPVLDVPGPQLAPDDDQPARVGVRQRPQQHRVDDAENRGAGADAERDRDRRDRREAGVLPQAARCVRHILEPGVDHDLGLRARSVPDSCASRRRVRWRLPLARARDRPDAGRQRPESDTRTSIFPKFRPSKRPMSAAGAASSPSTMSSRNLMRPSRTSGVTSARKAGNRS